MHRLHVAGALGITLAIAGVRVPRSTGPARSPVPRAAVALAGAPAAGRAARFEPQDSAGRKRVEIGFGIGPLRQARRVTPALERVAADGFRVIRAYELFRPKDGSSFAPVTDNLRFLDSLGFVPYLDISDFPFGLAPTPRQIAAGHYAFPAAKRAGVFRYSNLYPPTAAQYDSVLAALLSALDSAFGRPKMRRWWFEIGNEPDAPHFFWGEPAAFDTLLSTAFDRFHSFDRELRVGGAAFTAGLVSDNAAKSEPYTALARRLAASSGSFVSFHVYAGSFPNDAAIGPAIHKLLGDGQSATRVVSEWNLNTKPNPDVNAALNSEGIMPYLIDALAMAYEANIRLLLIHKLMDEPPNVQLGLFSGTGQPKGGYASVVQVARFAREGYTLVADGDAIRLVGQRLTMIHAGSQPVAINRSAYEIVRRPQGAPDNVVPAGGWVVLRQR